jgi:hypothetical protein
MGNKLVVCGDLHLNIEEPHFSAGKAFINWFLEQEFNNEENYFIQLGDLYQHSNPNPLIHELGAHWLSSMKFKKKYIMIGNHCYNRSRNSYSVSPLSKIENTEIVYSPKVETIGSFSFLMMPFLYDKVNINCTQKEYYENKENMTLGVNIDNIKFAFHHLQDNSIKFFEGDESGIDLSWFKGELVGGHIHKKQKNYCGSPIITRFDERGKDSYILILDLETLEKEYVPIPRFLDYKNIDFDSDRVPHQSEPLGDMRRWFIYDIVNATSKDAAEEKFKGLYLRNIELKKSEEEIIIEESSSTTDDNIIKTFDSFAKKQKLSKKVYDKVRSCL